MDISFTNVLKGARQYFQGLPAAPTSAGAPLADDHHHTQHHPRHHLPTPPQQQQQQQQPYNHHHPHNHLPPAPAQQQRVFNTNHHHQQQLQQQQQQRPPSSSTENDGSVRSEQHSAVPVYWDQQNEGQAAANLTNAPPLVMSQQQQAAGNGSRAYPPYHNHHHHPQQPPPPQQQQQHQQGGGGYYKGNYATSNGNAKGGGGELQPPSQQGVYQSAHISTAAGGSKTYYELQTNRPPIKAASSTTSAPMNDGLASRYAGYANSYYAGAAQPPHSNSSSSTSSSQDAQQYNYKAYGTPQQQQQHAYYYNSNSTAAQHQTTTTTMTSTSTAAVVAQRRHLPVQTSNNLYHSNAKSSANPAPYATAAATAAGNVNKSLNTSSFNGHAQPNTVAGGYSYYSSNTASSYAYTTTTTTTTTTIPTRPNTTTTTPYAQKAPAPRAKRESPLDLSVKTVRTIADSTHADAEERNNYQHHHHHQQRRYDMAPTPSSSSSSSSLARAPKVDFAPNFAMQREKAPPPAPPPTQNNYYNYSYATSALPKVDFDFQQRKRSLDAAAAAAAAATSAIPAKIPKVDKWRENIDKQIEQRLNSYLQSRMADAQNSNATTNGDAVSMPPTHYPVAKQSQKYPFYNNSLNHHQGSPLKINKEPATTSTKPQANKKVLNLLRTSLQNKGKNGTTTKKTSVDHHQHQQQPLPMSYHEVLQPSTDVMAPLQPKPGIVGRRNVSPFTAASLEQRNSSTPPTYKLHLPKAVDSVIMSSHLQHHHHDDGGEKEQQVEAALGGQSAADMDGLAAFLAARIRTKAELKQVGSSAAAGNNNGFAVSPPMLQKEPPGGVGVEPPQPSQSPALPKKLFCRADMKRSEVRSSSETSVFDFPDSDNETEMPVLERQSLLHMRKDRKAVSKSPTRLSQPEEEESAADGTERGASPFSLLFQQTCDNFVEQLKTGSGKKRGRRKKDEFGTDDSVEGDSLLEVKKEIEDLGEVVVKQEPPDEELPDLETTTAIPVPDDSKSTTTIIEPVPIIKTEQTPVVKPHNSDSDSDTPLVHLASKQKKKYTKKEVRLRSDTAAAAKRTRRHRQEKAADCASSDSEVEKLSRKSAPSVTVFAQPKLDFYATMKSPIAICKPGKKPTFGDGSDFRPGWEDALYRYKKAIRIPMQLIQVTRPPSALRLSTSLPDLDPYPCSPAPKTESIDDSDMDSSNCSFSFAKANYDSDQGSMRSFSSKCSILDKLLERYGGKKRKRLKKEDVVMGPKLIPKSDSDLLPTPSLEISDDIVKGTSALLGFRKKTVDNFKDAFINNTNKIVGVNEFNTVVLKARTRTETRVLKEKATIREVFGEDRPASAPPVTCVDELKPDEPSAKDKDKENNYQLKKEFNDVLIKAIESKKLEIDVEHIKKEKDDDSVTVISTDSVETSVGGGGKRRNKLRRKFSSGFDYIRKKKKQVKKDDASIGSVNEEQQTPLKSRRRGIPSKATPVSVDDIQKEIKQWVLNKGVGETHLHRASRCGYTDITAYCLEKMSCNATPKDNAGYTPLHEACSKGHLDIARLLLQYGAQVSASAQGGIRPLHEAAENGFVEIIRLLLSYGADPSLATYSGLTPLQLANDDVTITILQQHLDELQGKLDIQPWTFTGPAKCFDGSNDGFDPLGETPESDPQSELEDIEFECSEQMLPNLYALPDGETAADRWVLLQDLSNVLKIKSKETLLRQLNITAPTKGNTGDGELVREMKMVEFLETARCCQFMNANEKLNTRQSKVLLIKYTDKVKRLLNVETITFAGGGAR